MVIYGSLVLVKVIPYMPVGRAEQNSIARCGKIEESLVADESSLKCTRSFQLLRSTVVFRKEQDRSSESRAERKHTQLSQGHQGGTNRWRVS